MPKVLLCVALKNELPPSLVPAGIRVVYTGVGKINASIAVTNEINSYKPELIVNFGTAGGINSRATRLCTIKEVVQRDMIAIPLAERGVTPFDETPRKLKSISGEFSCATGDSFVIGSDPWLIQEKIDLVDMELFAIAKACNKFQIPWRAVKYITDNADQNAAENWSVNLERASLAFLEVAEELFKEI
jgi:adenosylhomocysteine nucleosidase